MAGSLSGQWLRRGHSCHGPEDSPASALQYQAEWSLKMVPGNCAANRNSIGDSASGRNSQPAKCWGH